MSSDISKLAVFDSRIVQSRPAFAVSKGALSVTNSPFNAISATSSQQTYQIWVPSENVFVDRHLLWTSSVYMTSNVAIPAATVAAQPGTSVAAPGVDFALAPLPLNQLVSTMSATINDTTSTVNSSDVLAQLLRMTDLEDNRMVRTCPTYLDTTANYNDCYGTQANPLAGYENATRADKVPNGAFTGLVFTDNAGTPLSVTADTYNAAGNSTPAFTGAAYSAKNGVPVLPQIWAVGTAYVAGQLVTSLGISYLCNTAVTGGNAPATNVNFTAVANGTYATGVPIYFKWTSTEPVCLAPFVFSDEHEWSTGLFGINSIQLLMNLQSSPARAVRSTTRNGRTLSAAAFNTGVAAGVFQGAQINAVFLTPSLDVPLPPKSVVPYMEYPRFISQSVSCAALSETQITSQTITLPQIPDLLIVYAKPTAYGAQDADWFLPLSSVQTGGTRAPLSVNFDNFSGLLSAFSTEELFNCSVKNGLKMDWETWCGVARSASSNSQSGARIQTVGGPLVLMPSQDISLQAGQAPSLVGNFTLQLNMTVYNPTAAAVNASLYIITVNSGFFESIRGSSRIIKGVLSEQDIIDAPRAGMVARSELDRMVGGVSLKSLGNVLSKARDIYQSARDGIRNGVVGAVDAVHGAVHGEGRSGGGRSGGGRSGGKKSLESRLMH